MHRHRAAGTPTEPLCPLCGHDTGIIHYRYEDYQLISCERCGLWRACPRPSPEQLERYYEQEYYSQRLADEGRYEEWRDANLDVWQRSARLVLDEARRKLNLPQWPRPSVAGIDACGGKASTLPAADRSGPGPLWPGPAGVRLLDVGCGQGFFLQQAIALGLVGRGIEPSPHAVDYARRSLNLDVRQMTPEQLPAEERYHIITLWEVLEHVPDPLATLRRLREHLHDGGMIWVTVPNVNALQRRLAGRNYYNFLNRSHLTHFDRRTLAAMLEKAGFHNIRRIVHFGGGGRRGPGALAQYAARWLCLGTDLRFVAER